ncbi:gamma-mobile-trio protein GmtX [Pseudoalteromonas phenolica]|uniref:gamma-mobile-trio protein GmtX n=1 Tax=Pseudoalteromonas phenolica TaxID=161398 RepID=UPI00110B23AD|nr:gamma-mobile-trio protein GmtX [Pseudoalteromonas phenolica]TMO56360.1 hypothetical protein CWC21_06570 [Pseudoalteromonas phenolica]
MTEHIENLYQALRGDCKRSDARKNLELLKSTLDEQVKRGSTVFQLPTLASLMKATGGPSLQTMQNASGERYRTLIEAYKVEYVKPLLTNKGLSGDDWIERIEQTDIRFLVKEMRAQLKKLRAENDTLRSVKQLHIDMRPQATQQVGLVDAQSPRSGMMQIPTLLTSERETVIQLLDEEYLTQNKLHYDERGALWYQPEKYPVQISGRKLQSLLESILTVDAASD